MNRPSPGATDLGPGWLPQCSAFYRHWLVLRGNALMPTSEHFLDDPPAAQIPTCYIAEITSDGAMVRFQGAELIRRWRSDITGRELHRNSPPAFKKKSLSNTLNIVTRPCGHLSRLSYNTSIGRQMTSELILLPLAAQPGRPPRLVCYAQTDVVPGPDETVAQFLKTHRVAWLDIGAGVPDFAPFDYDE